MISLTSLGAVVLIAMEVDEHVCRWKLLRAIWSLIESVVLRLVALRDHLHLVVVLIIDGSSWVVMIIHGSSRILNGYVILRPSHHMIHLVGTSKDVVHYNFSISIK